MKKRLLIVGGRGSGEIAMSVFEDVNSITDEWEISGYLNDIINPGDFLGKYKVLGSSDSIMDFVNKGYYVHYALHFNAKQKRDRVEKLKNYNIPIEAHASAVHPLAYLNPTAKIGNGVLMQPFAATSVGVEIKNFVHIYTNGYMAHDSIIGDYVTVTAHSIIGARVMIMEGAHIGLNACIREDLSVGKYSVIGMGSVIVNNIADYDIVVGNPGKVINNIYSK